MIWVLLLSSTPFTDEEIEFSLSKSTQPVVRGAIEIGSTLQPKILATVLSVAGLTMFHSCAAYYLNLGNVLTAGTFLVLLFICS